MGFTGGFKLRVRFHGQCDDNPQRRYISGWHPRNTMPLDRECTTSFLF